MQEKIVESAHVIYLSCWYFETRERKQNFDNKIRNQQKIPRRMIYDNPNFILFLLIFRGK